MTVIHRLHVKARIGRFGVGACSTVGWSTTTGLMVVGSMVFASMVAGLMGGCSAAPPPPPPLSSSAEPAPYVIGVSDVLRITVLKHPDLEVNAPVRPDGKIAVPMIDDIQAAGLTPEQLKDAISEKLSKSVNEPGVTVHVVDSNSRVVTVLGGVARSGRIALEENMGVFEAVAAAGGFSAWANKGNVRVIRQVGDEKVSYRFAYRDYMKGAPGSDMLLQPGDVVVVPE